MKSTFLVIVVFFLVFQAQAEVITIFGSNRTISNGDNYDTVVIRGNSTVVEMTGGSVGKLITMDASTFNMTGGTIDDESSDTGIRAYDTSVLNLSGGNIYNVLSFGESKVNISGSINNNSSADSHFYGSSVVTILPGGSFGNVSFLFYDNSTFNLEGGSVRFASCSGHSSVNIANGTISYALSVGDYTFTNIFGGIINELGTGNQADVTLLGGTINAIGGESGAKIRIIGYDLDVVPYGGSFGYGQASGYWNDDTYFTINLQRFATYSVITLYDGVIPPICINKPESDLNDDCLVNFTDFCVMASEWLYDGTQ